MCYEIQIEFDISEFLLHFDNKCLDLVVWISFHRIKMV